MKRRGKLYLWGFAVVAGYITVSLLVWALRHPEMTETQRLLHFLDAMLWRS